LPPLWAQALPLSAPTAFDGCPARTESFINKTLWPEYLEISRALDDYLNEATERIIREEVFGDAEEAEERTEASPSNQILT
jgi:hypothetical protein